MKLMVKAAGRGPSCSAPPGACTLQHHVLHDAWWCRGCIPSSARPDRPLSAGGRPQGAHEKGRMKAEPINVIAFCGDGGGADMGSAPSPRR